MHLLGRAGGFPAQDALWALVAKDLVRLHLPDVEEWKRVRALMQQYADAPMDLGDASLVAAAERLGLRRVFTIDSGFRAYRPHGKGAFDVVP